jgi:dihydroneopterin aldolase
MGKNFTECAPDRHWSEIFIDSLSLDMVIGVHDHEKKTPQKVVISLTARVAAPPLDRDDLDAVVSYGDIVRTIKTLAQETSVHLVETFGEKIAAACLADPRVRSVTIRIVKPQACTQAHGVGVVLHRLQPQSKERSRP